ncbi:effector-associated domain EAD1-containing protein [Streptomyces sp. C10-9-1]|uniref:effector-associated domain EAD1-containing protein n=1 Tax=Streptomyces sp. C10-9-1 TaxID=1859285 RepID=UPI0021115A7B|nr:effector-associated domain EAD1-containing protein [Streptomyces sp. C10-9-1]MCQ6553287.1 effector-associated domain EAD1-containing protein [Streptomyces sp. C10-9-1]
MLNLDARAFARWDADTVALLKALTDLFPETGPIKRLVQEGGLRLARFHWDRPADDLWPDVLEAAAAEGLLRGLLLRVADDPSSRVHHPLLRELLHREQPAGGVDPCQVRFIDRTVPKAFLDRNALRGHLRELLHDNGSRVLVVSGDRFTGKSWTWDLIVHVLGELGRGSSYLIDLDAWEGTPAGPADVMGEITDQLGWERAAVDPHEAEDTSARNLLSRFKGRIRGCADEPWFVFDGLDAHYLTPSALRMIEGLALAAERREAGGRMRVVLIGYERELPAQLAQSVLHERLGHPGVDDLRDFFDRVAASRGYRPDGEAVDLFVERVLEESMGEEESVGEGDRRGALPIGRVSRAAAAHARLLLSHLPAPATREGGAP